MAKVAQFLWILAQFGALVAWIVAQFVKLRHKLRHFHVTDSGFQP